MTKNVFGQKRNNIFFNSVDNRTPIILIHPLLSNIVAMNESFSLFDNDFD